MEVNLDQVNALIKDSFPGHVGIELTEVRPGYASCRIPVTATHLHPGGVVHGGVAFTMADTAMAWAVMASLDENQGCATIDMKISYFKAVAEGELVCVAKIIKPGKRIIFLEAEVTANNETVAKSSASFYILGS